MPKTALYENAIFHFKILYKSITVATAGNLDIKLKKCLHFLT